MKMEKRKKCYLNGEKPQKHIKRKAKTRSGGKFKKNASIGNSIRKPLLHKGLK
jgi:hypothetical protein